MMRIQKNDNRLLAKAKLQRKPIAPVLNVRIQASRKTNSNLLLFKELSLFYLFIITLPH